MNTIAAEHFSLTPAIRARVERKLFALGALLPPSAALKVFLGEPVRKTFSVVCKVRAWGKAFIVREEGDNLYRVIETARNHLARLITEEKQRWIRSRRMIPAPLASPIADALEENVV